MAQKVTANIRIRPDDHSVAKAEADRRRTDIANVISAWRHRWEMSTDSERQASFESFDQQKPVATAHG